ncbi:MAG: recombination protein RecR, partial [Muribaculaceae bacterium]|nr:recombination protein RecR [Muribaculaceae bacterium]
LVEPIKENDIEEVIIDLSSTLECETTNYYIYRMLGHTGVKITQLARGVAIGNEIEYTDEVTLGRSLLNRTLFSDSFKH